MRWPLNRSSGFYPKPAVAFTIAVLRSYQNPFSFELLAVQQDMKLSFPIVSVHNLISANVPDHYRTAAVFSLGNDALKSGILHRMVFGCHGKPSLVDFIRRAFRDRPGFQYTLHLKAQIIMQMTGRVFLDYKQPPVSLTAGLGDGRRRLGCFAEVAFSAIRLESFNILANRFCWRVVNESVKKRLWKFLL